MRVTQILEAKGDRVVTIEPGAAVSDVARVLRLERIGAVVVTDDEGAIRGIISERDIVHALVEHGPDLLGMPVSRLMSSPVITCTPEDTLEEIMRRMTLGHIRHLPVLVDGHLAGIISIGDVVKNRLEELERESSLLRDYIVSGG